MPNQARTPAAVRVSHFTLAELEDFPRFQHSQRYQSLKPQLTAAVTGALRTYQTTLVNEINARFRSP